MKERAVKIRPMEPSDAESVFALAEKCRLGYWSVTDYEMETRREDSFAAVAEIECEIGGFIIARLIMIKNDIAIHSYNDSIKNKQVKENQKKESREACKRRTSKPEAVEADVFNVCVKSASRRRGVGSELFDALVKYILAFDARTPPVIWLEVRKFNKPAVDFYLGKGFKVFSERRNFYTNPTEDALVLKAEIGNGEKGVNL